MKTPATSHILSGLTVSLCFLMVMLVSHPSYADTTADSLLNELQQQRDDTARVNVLLQLSEYYLGLETAEAIRYGTQARHLAEQAGYAEGLAYALKNIGIAYYIRGDYIETLNYWQLSLEAFESIGHRLGIANMQSNLGVIYFNQGDDARALEYYLKSLKVSEEIKDTLRIATALINIGAVHTHKEATLDAALDYYLRALPLCEALNDQPAIGTITVNLGEIYLSKDEDSLALIYFQRSLIPYKGSVSESFSYNSIGKVYEKWGDYSKAIEYQKRAYEIARSFDARMEMSHVQLSFGNTFLKMGDLEKARASYHDAADNARAVGANYELKNAYEGLARVYSLTGDFRNAFTYQTLFSNIKDTLYNIETDKKLSGLLFNFEIDKKQAQIDILYKDKALQELELDRQKLLKNSLFAGLLLLLVIAVVIFRNYRLKIRTNKVLDRQKAQIENLLLNILPAEVADELKIVGQATPRLYQSASVLFTDFKGFTSISKDLTPHELVAELNLLFSVFDEIIQEYGLEKIKTIGDAYMCAGGIPRPNATHPIDVVEAGLALQRFMYQHNKERKAMGLFTWDLRVGIHTGPLVAGVVGKKKYAYDIWGSTVNVASRMESNGEPGKVNVSNVTWELVKERFTSEHRGKIYAKNYGDIDMYFISGYRDEPATSTQQEGENLSEGFEGAVSIISGNYSK